MGKKSQLRREKKEQSEKELREIRKEKEREQFSWIYFWQKWTFWLYVTCVALIIAYPFVQGKLFKIEEKQVSQTTAVIHTSNGDVSIEFYDQDAPKTVENFVGLAKEGYYDNLTFHRVIKSFMIQGGDPSGNGTGGASLWGGKFADEINAESLGLSKDQIAANEKSGYTYRTDITSHKAEVGSIAMANSGPNSNGSQFFIITEQNQPSLDGKYTVFGHVTAGMEAVRAIAAVPVDANDKPTEQVTIDSITVN